jgi:hypothetical protein
MTRRCGCRVEEIKIPESGRCRENVKQIGIRHGKKTEKYKSRKNWPFKNVKDVKKTGIGHSKEN